MLSLKQIIEYYPQNIGKFKRHLLREYLQYKILEIIFNSKIGSKLVFIGGTALRLVYGNQRFSEDLDFDNFNLSRQEFISLSNLVKKKLDEEGLKTEIKIVLKDAFRCYVKVPELLYKEALSSMDSEKINIQIDTFSQDFDFNPRLYNLDKFDVFSKIKVVPFDLLLAHKIFAIFNRKRRKGRDFFDIDFMISNKNITPDFNYLKQKMNIMNPQQLKEKLKKDLQTVDFGEMAEEVEDFLFNPKQKERVINFYNSIDGWSFKERSINM